MSLIKTTFPRRSRPLLNPIVIDNLGTMDGYLTTSEAAKRLGVTSIRVRQLIAENRLPAERFGRAYLVKESDLAKVKDRPNGRPAKL